jgi:hypothetical protein
MAAVAALPEQPDHVDGLLEHLQVHVGLRPAVAEDVLVLGLAAADAELEAAVVRHAAGRRGLRDHRGVDPHGRARDRGRDRQGRRLRQRADHRPHERAMALLVVPRVVVVRDPQGMEAGRLGATGLLHEIARTELLAGKQASDLHASELPGHTRPGSAGGHIPDSDPVEVQHLGRALDDSTQGAPL